MDIAFADGLATVSTHNGVHRLVWYKLTPEGQPDHVLELVLPARSIDEIIEALLRLRGDKSPVVSLRNR